jgi:two-component system response regulator CpxR
MSSTTYNMLIVDDDREVRTLLQEVFEMEGFTVQTAKNGEEAMSALREAKESHVILLDLMMPVRDGWAVYRELAQDEHLRDHHCIVIETAKLQAAPAEFPLAGGFVHKPFHLKDLLTQVDNCLAS